MLMDDVWNYSGSFTLQSELTKEDWDKITDVEMENTPRITFITPQGRQVRYVKCDILDKIRAEIEAACCITVGRECDGAITLHDVFEIIDKYIESEGV